MPNVRQRIYIDSEFEIVSVYIALPVTCSSAYFSVLSWCSMQSFIHAAGYWYEFMRGRSEP